MKTLSRIYETIIAAGALLAAGGLLQAQSSAVQPPPAQAPATSRDAWQRVPDVLAALDAKPGSRIADIGAGGGYFTDHLRRVVGDQGRVYAVDVSSNAVVDLHTRLDAAGARNVDVVLGTTADPRLPFESLDAVLIVNAYHEMTEYQAILARIKEALRPNGRLVIVDNIPKDPAGTRAAQTTRHQIGIDLVAAELRAAGFALVQRDSQFIPQVPTYQYQPMWILVAQRTEPPLRPPPMRMMSGASLVSSYENPNRVAELQVDRVIETLKLAPSAVVADIGAGSGLFSRSVARALPGGTVFGIDIDSSMVAHIKSTAEQQALRNLKTILATPEDPKIPQSADVILLIDVVHQIGDRPAYLAGLRRYLKPGGRVVVIDPINNWPSRPDRHYTADDLEQWMSAAGFKAVERYDYVARRFFIVFQ